MNLYIFIKYFNVLYQKLYSKSFNFMNENCYRNFVFNQRTDYKEIKNL